MKNDIELSKELLEDLNDLYKLNGDNLFKRLRKLLEEKPGSIFSRPNLKQAIKQHNSEPNYDIAVRLISTYCDQIKKDTNDVDASLEDWMLKSLEKIALGDDPKECFGLVRKRQRPVGSSSFSALQICTAHALHIRNDKTPTEAKKKITEDWGIEEHTINRALKKIPIAEHIQTGLLKELAQRDYTKLYGQGH